MSKLADKLAAEIHFSTAEEDHDQVIVNVGLLRGALAGLEQAGEALDDLVRWADAELGDDFGAGAWRGAEEWLVARETLAVLGDKS